MGVADKLQCFPMSLKVPEGGGCGSAAVTLVLLFMLFVYLLFFAWQHLTLRHAHPLNIYILLTDASTFVVYVIVINDILIYRSHIWEQFPFLFRPPSLHLQIYNQRNKLYIQGKVMCCNCCGSSHQDAPHLPCPFSNPTTNPNSIVITHEG